MLIVLDIDIRGQTM